jgi:hypothetical protein
LCLIDRFRACNSDILKVDFEWLLFAFTLLLVDDWRWPTAGGQLLAIFNGGYDDHCNRLTDLAPQVISLVTAARCLFMCVIFVARFAVARHFRWRDISNRAAYARA